MRPTAARRMCHTPRIQAMTVARTVARMERSDIRDRRPRISLRSMRATGPTLLRGLGVADIAPAVAAHPHIGLLGMAQETFQHAQPRAVLSDYGARLVGQHLLER